MKSDQVWGPKTREQQKNEGTHDEKNSNDCFQFDSLQPNWRLKMGFIRKRKKILFTLLLILDENPAAVHHLNFNHANMTRYPQVWHEKIFIATEDELWKWFNEPFKTPKLWWQLMFHSTHSKCKKSSALHAERCHVTGSDSHWRYFSTENRSWFTSHRFQLLFNIFSSG